ncbi:hypothetical protein H4R99_000723 [Coemansia sp. RSA 1722]|nr:hypothetical protein IWW45_000635 [Coemansia sp. RSA 485]KAJ2602496.1 hypothetical protein GGF39_000707 [Coemansia sp. RSA 1721]KAJ2606018.1 hypothetical protein H4R99_000723 [Coemansia sp. RSA 1722]KAJ2639592.1 hypothetical protein GGF40_000704 [Coemansia sp. RSA 1286]
MAASAAQKDAGADGAAAKDDGRNAAATTDVEATKRNLQALVAAGIHAQGLLQNESSDEEDDDDDEDDDEEQGGEEIDYREDEGESNQMDEIDASSHQALLSRVASNFRALIGHGLTTAAPAHGGGPDDLSPPLDNGAAYSLACDTLASNLRCQRALRAQLAEIEAAQRRNGELQAGIGALLTIQARASNRRGARRGVGGARADERSAVDPVTGEARIGGGLTFIDVDGARPPDNRDTVRKKKHPPIVYRARRWTDGEREALVRGVRACNRKIMAQRIYAQTQDPRSVWDVDAMGDAELEMNLAGLDWKYISRQFVPQHKPVECAIQWATQDHPIINRAPWSKREESALATVVGEHGGRDWVAIAKALDTQRTAAQCFQVYQRKINPDMSRSKWSPEEDRVLTEAVMAYGEGDWQAVAACLDNRTGQQVLHRWCKSINPAIRSGRWDRDEDIALLAAVRLYGVGQWTKIAKHVPGRTDVKCRERYMNVLTPDVNNAQWSSEEDARLIAIVNRVGIGKWSYVADLLGARTDNQCWRHWRSLHKRGAAPDPPPIDATDLPEEGTVPSFPEWEAERDEAHLGFASTQGGGRKRKTTSGIESARKRQWKRATSTNFVPLLASPVSASSLSLAAHPTPPRTARSRSAAAGLSRAAGALSPTPSAASVSATTPGSRSARPSLSLNMGVSPEALVELDAVPAAQRRNSLRRGRVLNWNSVLQMGVERKDVAAADPDSHIRSVLPTLLTSGALQQLINVVPEVADAFNAALCGLDEESPPMDSVPMSWLRQRIEALFIWPLMLGTLDLAPADFSQNSNE